jgi:hypothetical protein
VKKPLSYLLVAVLALAGYALSPFYAAWQLREAIKAGDTATIARKVEFESVRASVRESIRTHADLIPAATELGRQVKPSWWQRVKTAFGASMVDRFIETYISPEGLPKLANYGKTWRETVRSKPDDDARPWHQRLANFWSRVKRAELTGITRAVLEVADRHDPSRSYVGVFELSGFEWKLTRLHILTGANADRLARL